MNSQNIRKSTVHGYLMVVVDRLPKRVGCADLRDATLAEIAYVEGSLKKGDPALVDSLVDSYLDQATELSVGDRVEGGATTEDRDTGTILAVNADGTVDVGWDSHVRTAVSAGSLRALVV